MKEITLFLTENELKAVESICERFDCTKEYLLFQGVTECERILKMLEDEEK